MKIGVGLGSTCERLAMMYPEQQTFSLRGLPEGGAEVRITIPLRFAESINGAGIHEQVAAADR